MTIVFSNPPGHCAIANDCYVLSTDVWAVAFSTVRMGLSGCKVGMLLIDGWSVAFGAVMIASLL